MSMLIEAILGGMGSAMNGFQDRGSSQHGNPFVFMIPPVRSPAMPLLTLPVLPIFPRQTQNCEKMISMGISDIYGSIPEGFS